MDSINGGLGFKATIDLDSFNVSADAMERRIRQVSGSAVSEFNEMDNSLLNFAQNGARYIATYLVGQGLGGLAQSIISVRGQFQQLEIAFETMLGSSQKANELMNQLITTAAKTPFDLQGVASGAKQLMAYGEASDKVNEKLVRLGNIASGLSIPLNDIVYLYGTTMVQGRLYAQDVRQFTGRGIPLVKELAKMYGKTSDEINRMVSEGKIGFADVEKVMLGMTEKGGQFYNLMEKQSKSLTGMIANLGDAWDVAKNKFGADNQEVFAKAIQGATYFVENMDEVLRIVKAITVAYGSYKGAVALNTLVTKGYTGVALIDNTVRSAKLALLRIDEALTGKKIAQTKAMTLAQEANTASLEKQLTVEELGALKKQLRIATIQSLLTAQQQEYISNLNLTASSASYESVALSVLSVEQKEALSKADLSSKSALYRSALEQEVLRKNQSKVATIEAMRAEVASAHVKLEGAKQSAIASMQSVEALKYEVYWAKQSGDAHLIATAEKKLEAGVEKASLARKVALSAQTDFYAKKKALESATTRGATVATVADSTAKAVNATSTSLLATVTAKATLATKALWASMMSNPIGWVVSGIGLLVSALTYFSGRKKEATDAVGEFQDATRKEIDNLNLLFSILQTSERGTKAHKDAIEKVNAICKEYNKTLLEENDSLSTQKTKYEELTKAIQETTAEKIKAKYIEQALQTQTEANTKALDDLKESAENAYHKTSKGFVTVLERGQMVQREMFDKVASKNIREASGAVWDAVEQDVLESVRKLKGLSGDAYNQVFNEILNRVVNKVQKSTKANSEEINSFREHIKIYLTSVAETAKKTEAEIGRVDAQMRAFYEKKDNSTITESVDYVSMSFSDLERKIKETQKEIDDINAKKVNVDTDNTKLLELQGLLATIRSAITTKTNALNTEAGISDRIKQLKDERANVEINSKRYKELTKEIQGLESKLPKSGTGNSSQKEEQLLQKRLDAERRIEEARISVMSEGYEKRKATLDLQHKQNLQQIDREERELIKAYKDAGKSISTSEKEAFDERRRLSNESYENLKIKLFDGEIEYKKEQYKAYHKWVENVGKEEADKYFAHLLKSGNSFVGWVNEQVQLLESKKAKNGTLSDSDANSLNALKEQLKELSGSKSSMENFSESVGDAINQAKTLSERLDAIVKAKEKLESGKFHLNADDKAQAYLYLDKEQEKAQKEINQRVLQDFKAFEEQRTAIEKEYALLRSVAQKENDAKRLELINKAEEEAKSALNANFLRQSESWKKLFGDLDALSADEIAKLIRNIEEKLKEANLSLNPVDYKALVESLEKAEETLVRKNPFKAIGAFYDDYIKARKTLAQAKANLASGVGGDDDVKKAEADVRRASNGITKSIDSITSIANECGNAVASMFSNLGEDELASDMQDAMKLFGELGNTAMSVGKLMAGDVLGGITGLISSLSSLVSIFSKMNNKAKERTIKLLKEDIEDLERSYQRLERTLNKAHWSFSEEQKKAFQENKALLEKQIKDMEAVAMALFDIGDVVGYSDAIKKIQELKKQLRELGNSGDTRAIFNSMKENLDNQLKNIQEAIKTAQSKDKKDDKEIQQLKEKEEAIKRQQEDLAESIKNTFAGIDVKSAIDEFADAIVDAYSKGENAAEALGEKTKQVLKRAVIEALKRQFLAKGIEDAINYLSEAMADGILSEDEKKRFEEMVNNAGNLFNTALEGIGDWAKDIDAIGDKSSLQGAIASLSEETGGAIAGRLQALIINQGEVTDVMRKQLLYQVEIANNTKVSALELSEIKFLLRMMGASGKSLLSMGVS